MLVTREPIRMQIWIFAVVTLVSAFVASQPQNRSKRDATSAMFDAIEKGNENEAIRLIENAANINATKKWNKTLHGSKWKGDLKVFEFLDLYGQFYDDIPTHEWNPLHFSAYFGYEKTVEALLRNGVNVNAKDNLGWTSLILAVFNHHSKIVEILVEHGAEMNVKTNLSWTPLHFSAHWGDEEITKYLLRHGADVTLKNIDGKTPLDMADIGKLRNPKIIDVFDPRRLAVQKLQKACDEYSSEDLIDFIGESEAAEPGEFPWMAVLGYDDATTIQFKCSGTIISDRFILTAAHCIKEDKNKWPKFVRLGATNLTDISAKNYHIEAIYRHPNYTFQSKQNDIALILLSKEIVFNPDVRPACLETDLKDLKSEVRLTIMGWGSTSAERYTPSNQLRKAEVVTVPLFECSKMYLHFNDKANHPELENGISQSQYCAYDSNGRSDVNRGDSGGPLQVIQNSRTAHVIGITSFGIASGTLPSIYTRVASYTEWIAEHVWPDSQH